MRRSLHLMRAAIVVAAILIATACTRDTGFTIYVDNPCSVPVAVETWHDTNPSGAVDARTLPFGTTIDAESETSIASIGEGFEFVVSLVGRDWVERQVAPPEGGEIRFRIDPGSCPE